MAFKAFHGGGLTAENSTVILEVGEIVQFFVETLRLWAILQRKDPESKELKS